MKKQKRRLEDLIKLIEEQELEKVTLKFKNGLKIELTSNELEDLIEQALSRFFGGLRWVSGF